MKNKLLLWSLIFIGGITLIWCWKYISKKEAQNSALLDAGFDRNEVVFTDTELDREEWVYEIEFIANWKYRYEYEVNARNGEIMVNMNYDRD